MEIMFAAEERKHESVLPFGALEQVSLPVYPQGTRSNPAFRW